MMQRPRPIVTDVEWRVLVSGARAAGETLARPYAEIVAEAQQSGRPLDCDRGSRLWERFKRDAEAAAVKLSTKAGLGAVPMDVLRAEAVSAFTAEVIRQRAAFFVRSNFVDVSARPPASSSSPRT